ncbi:MAG: HAD family hydrolase [Solirubrobacterales bacterium]|nr:HAD family hydrolase [Solirubrobacterales bacterium]
MLLLFDIDGTLLSGATEAHREAMHAALREVHGVDADALGPVVEPAGRTDPEIARVILLDAGISADRIDELASTLRQVCCRIYTELAPDDLSHTVLPGVRELLEWLAEQHHSITLGLLTGNYEPIARLKLARAGIGSHFAGGQGAFGSDAEDRAALPAIARRRAGSRGNPCTRQSTIVIGDTPRDIACARADGVRCFAVASGPFPVARLGEADFVAEDASALKPALEETISPSASDTACASSDPRSDRARSGAG